MNQSPREGQTERSANSGGGEPRAESKHDELQGAAGSTSSVGATANFQTSHNQSAGQGFQNNNLLDLAGTSLSDFHNPLHPLRQMQQAQAQAQANSRNNQGRMAPPQAVLDLASNFGGGGGGGNHQYAADRLRLAHNIQIQQLMNQQAAVAAAAANRTQGNAYAPSALISSGRSDFTMQLLMASGHSIPSSLLSQTLNRNIQGQQQQQLNQMCQFQAGSAAAVAANSLQGQGQQIMDNLNASELMRLSQMGAGSLSSFAGGGGPAQSNQIRQAGNNVREEILREMLLPARGNNASASWANPTSLATPVQGLAGFASGAGQGRDLTGVASAGGPIEDVHQVRPTASPGGGEAQAKTDSKTGEVAKRASVGSSDPSLPVKSKADRKRKAVPASQPSRRRKRKARDPVVVEGVPHHTEREFVSLGIEEDPNWLSEFQCFVRTELMEVIQASQSDVLVRSTSKSILPNQVGVRCRYCAHLAPGSRVCRSSAFPSSLDKLYQSFSMMVRDHFGKCPAVPPEKAQEFQSLKQKNAQGATDSKQYWVYAAQKLGMVDAESGIERTEESRKSAEEMPPYGGRVQQEDDQEEETQLVGPEDKSQLTPFLYDLMRHLQLVRLLPSERVGKRKGLSVGLEGLGCKYCCREGRLGFSRCFPLRRRALPSHVLDLYRHCLRCPLCPEEVKKQLEQAHQLDHEANNAEPSSSVDSYAIIWTKLGRQRDLTTS